MSHKKCQKRIETKHENKLNRKWTRIYFGTWPKIPLKKVEFFVPICLGFRWLYRSKPFFGNERSCSHEKAIVNKAIINPIYIYRAYLMRGQQARGYSSCVLWLCYEVWWTREMQCTIFAQCLKITKIVSFSCFWNEKSSC